MSLSLDWIGGFFDADGSITLSRRVRRREGTEKVEYVPALSIGQSDPGILEEISRVLGGGSVHKTRDRGSINSFGVGTNRDHYVFRADNAKAIEICRKLIPVTFCKRKELEQVVAYYEKYNNFTKGWARWGGENYTRRYDEMVREGDACRARLNLIRTNKDTLDVTI